MKSTRRLKMTTKVIEQTHNYSDGKEIFVAISVDDKGNQGILGMLEAGSYEMALVSLQEGIIPKFKKAIEHLEQYTDYELRIVRFSNPEIIYSNKSNDKT